MSAPAIKTPAGLADYYAEVVAGRGGVTDPRIKTAFAAVRREDFLGPGPWAIATGMSGYVATPSADPAFLYADVVVALVPERGLNNGEPSFHARCLTAVAIQPGESVIHVGAGTGYFSALMAELAGPEGAVHAVEVDEALAARAAANLEPWPQAQVHARSGLEGPLPSADVIYVNAGVSAVSPAWLDALKPGGRLLVPMTAGWMGVMFLFTARGDGAFDAQAVSGTAIIPCVGGQDEAAARRLAKALGMSEPGAGLRSLSPVKSLRRGGAPDDSCWLEGDGWWLSTAAAH